MGKPGYILTPSSRWETGKPTGIFGVAYIPREYAVKQFFDEYYNELMLHSTVDLTSFLRVTLNLAYLPEIPERMGVGDRHVDISLRLLKERKYIPSLAIIITPPIGVSDPMTYNLAVASKQIGWNDKKQIEISVGYGLEIRYLDYNGALRNGLKPGFYPREDFNEHYLNGFFVGSRFMPFEWLGFTAEYDSKNINGGVFVTLAKILSLQVTAYGFDRFGGMIHLNLPLVNKPWEFRKYEKN
nr:YjbH domain-containing protein [Cognataquiflexum nitidum]